MSRTFKRKSFSGVKELLHRIFAELCRPFKVFRAFDEFNEQDQIEESRILHEPWDGTGD